MPVVGVSIVKSTSFRGVAQEFSNTYYYTTPLPVVSAVATSLIDHLVTLEKPMHAPSVSFVRGKCWSAGGTPGQNEMISQKALSGVGTNSSGSNTNLDKERAVLVRFRAGNDSKGRPVYLRKWWHLDVAALGASNTITDGQKANTAGLSGAQTATVEAWGNAVKSITALPQNFDLVSDKGRGISGATVAHPYLEHHQLGDMWRG